MWIRTAGAHSGAREDMNVGEYGQIFQRSFVQKMEEERMGDTGRGSSYHSGFTGLGDERNGEASVRIMVFINCFAFILYPLSTTI